MLIQHATKASHTSNGFFERTGDKIEYLENTSITWRTIRSSKNNKSTCNFSLKAATNEVPAIGKCGALSKARHTSHWFTTSSTCLRRGKLSPSASTRTRLICWAEAWPQFTCNFSIIFFGSEMFPSRASPRVTALHAEKEPGGEKLHNPSAVNGRHIPPCSKFGRGRGGSHSKNDAENDATGPL